MRHYSFTLSRPGLKPGHYVPLRLRIVDTLTGLSGVPMVIVMFGVVFLSLGLADKIGLGAIWRSLFAFYAYVIVVTFVVGWTLWFASTFWLRVIFRSLGMLTRDEAVHYPLEVSKKDIAPWPESWQKPEDGNSKEVGTDGSSISLMRNTKSNLLQEE